MENTNKDNGKNNNDATDNTDSKENKSGFKFDIKREDEIAKEGTDSSEVKTTDSDSVLHIPEVKEEKISINVNDLEAHVSLNSKLDDLVKVNIGAEVQKENKKERGKE